VKRVIDGDTLELIYGQKVRLFGIDCPEAGTKKGIKAFDLVKAIMDLSVDNKVVLKYDIEQRDKNGRLLAYVYIYSLEGGFGGQTTPLSEEASRLINSFGMYYERVNGRDMLFLNATIIKSGYAKPMNISANVKYNDIFKELYQEARQNKRGLWKESKISKEDAIRIAQNIWIKAKLNLSNFSAHKDKNEWVVNAESFIEGQGKVILTMRLDGKGNLISDNNTSNSNYKEVKGK